MQKKIQKLKKLQKPTYVKFAVDVDFFALFRQIEEKYETCFIFESLGDEGKFSRYSIIGFSPEQVIGAKGGNLLINGEKYPVKNPYAALRRLMPAPALASQYAGGLVGYLSYEAANYMESALHVQVSEDFDQFLFGVYKDGLIFDKVTNELTYFFYEIDRGEEIRELMRVRSPRLSFEAEVLREGLSKEEHRRIVEDVKEKIRAGNTFQCEVGFKTEYTVSGNPLFVYERLREINPSPFMYFLKFGEKKIVGASPELLFSLRSGEMTTRPLAGTIRRGKTDAEDQRLARELANDEKEKAEHSMLVDLHRNDLGRVAQFGTVKVRDLMAIKKFSHVQHMSSEVVGTISKEHDMFSALASQFPMGTVTGTPKIETMKIIDANEPDARGPYGGGIGHFGFNGDCTFALALRSLFIAGDRAYSQTSSGIVYDSIPEKEFDEIRHKSAAMKKALGIIV